MKILFGYDEAANMLGISDSWLKKHKQQLPRRELGDRVLFSLQDLEEIAEMHAVRPGQQAPAAITPIKTAVPKSLLDLKPRGRKGA